MRKKGDRLDQLLDALLSSKKSDDEILDALCLATMARFPTATEKKLIFDSFKAQPNRATAWNNVVYALASTDESKAHAESLTKRRAK